jgi:tRNA pseudouridine55 synthase
LKSLCRTASGNVSLTDCVTLDQIVEAGADGVSRFALDPAQVLGLPVRRLSAAEVELVQNGRFLSAEDALDESCVSLVREGRLYGVWQAKGGLLRPRTNCPLGIEGVRA